MPLLMDWQAPRQVNKTELKLQGKGNALLPSYYQEYKMLKDQFMGQV